MKNSLLFLAITWFAVTGVYAQNYVQNGNFAAATTDEATGLILPEHWTLDGKATLDDGTWFFTLITSWLPDGATAGTQAVNLWRAGDEPYQLKLTQTITGLPDGMYTLSAVAALGGENVYSLYAKAGEQETTVSMPESATYEKKELDDIQITGGTVVVGFTANSSAASDWMDITHFEFVKTGNTATGTVVSSGLSMEVAGREIRVASGKPIVSANLYSIEGKKINAQKAVNGEILFLAPQAGVYVLNVGYASESDIKKLIIRQ